MTTNIITKQNVPQYTWGEKCKSFNLLNTHGLSVKLEEMPAGTTEKLHFHNKAKQLFYILKGTGTFYVETDVMEVKQNESVFIEPGQKHFITNRSGETIEFLVISQPNTREDRIETN